MISSYSMAGQLPEGGLFAAVVEDVALQEREERLHAALSPAEPTWPIVRSHARWPAWRASSARNR